MVEDSDQVAKIAFELVGRLTDDRAFEAEAARAKHHAASLQMAEVLRSNLSGNMDDLNEQRGEYAVCGFATGALMACWMLAVYHVGIEGGEAEEK